MMDDDKIVNVQVKPGAMKKQLASLPLVRFTTVATVLVAVDSLLCIGLWLGGGSSQYLENSVEEFSFLTSTFDLACMAAVRCVIFICCLYYLEYCTLVAASTRLEKKSLSSKRLAIVCHALLLILSLISFIYAVVKGALILVHLSDVAERLHIMYKILCVVGVAAPLVELAIAVSSIYFMWRLTHILKLRMTALSLDELEEEDGNGGKKKSKANLKRLALLAVPVSSLLLSSDIIYVYSLICVNCENSANCIYFTLIYVNCENSANYINFAHLLCRSTPSSSWGL